MNRALLSATSRKRADSSRWGTPARIYGWQDRLWGFTLDTCADAGNYKHPRYFDERANGLAQSWAGETYWNNPPYGRGIGQWLSKGRDECMSSEALGVHLVPARVDTEWWRRYVMQSDGEAGRLKLTRYVTTSRTLWFAWQFLIVGVHFFDERIPFDGQETDDGAPFPSAFVIFGSPSRRPPRIRTTPEQLEAEGFPAYDLTEGWPR